MTLCSMGQAFARDVPDFGLILNDDAYSAFAKPTPAESVAHLQGVVDSFAAGNIKTLTYSLGEGSDIMMYPTKVASTWGWRPTPKYDDQPAYKDRIARNRDAIAQGGDAIRVAGERAKAHKMYFIPSLRMNDSHFTSDPLDNPFTGRFWIEHQDLTIGRTPIAAQKRYNQLLDFSHEAVREYRLAQVFEAIDRYADLIDGFELDFNRVQIFFPMGEATKKHSLITDMVVKVRARLDALEKKNGRPYYLIARVAPSLESCDWAGLDVRTWMKRGLVDVVSPSQLMTLGYDMPMEPFVKAALGTDCKIYPSMLPRTVWRWPVKFDESELGKPARAASQEQIRAAAANLWHQGSDGLYLYNFRVGMLDDAVQDIVSREALAGTDKCFTITKGYYIDSTGEFEHRKQLPAEFKDGRVTGLELLVGDNFSKTRPKRAMLRLGLRGVPSKGSLQVTVNGKPVYRGPMDKVLRDVPPAKLTNKAPDLAHQLIFLPVKDFAAFKVGRNAISIQAPPSSTKVPATLTDVELMVGYGGDVAA